MNIGAGIGIGFAEPRGVLAFEYEQSSGCQNGSDITPVINTPGGTFDASPTGLSINSSTGVIDVSASTAGTYTVTYSIGPTEDTITIQAADDATFSYSASSFTQDGSNPTPTITGLSGGTFSAGSGLVFVDSASNTGSSTGEIDLSASTISSYTITYTTAGSCPNTSTQTVGITAALAQINNVYSMSFDGINDSVNVGLIKPFDNDVSNFAISYWVKANFNLSMCHFDFRYNGATRGVALENNSSSIFFYTGGNFGTTWSTPTSGLNNNEWNHIVINFDGSIATDSDKCEYWINGSKKTSTVGSPGNSFSKAITGDGFLGSGFTFKLTGGLDEFSTFNVTLTESEILSIYNATEIASGVSKTADLSQLTTPPVKWYRMGD